MDRIAMERGCSPIGRITCSFSLGLIITAIPKYTKGKLAFLPKNKNGQPLTPRVEAFDAPHDNSGSLLPPPGATERESVATGAGNGAVREIKEWQAIMDHLRSLPVTGQDTLPMIPIDARAAEVRMIKTA